jgi:hypothetical protein
MQTTLPWLNTGGLANYMGQLAVFRGDFSFRFKDSTFLGGQGPTGSENDIGYSFLPAIVFRPRVDGTGTPGGNFKFEQCWFVGRASVEQNYAGSAGGINWVIFRDIQTQNLLLPLVNFTSYPTANPVTGGVDLENISLADYPTGVVGGFNLGNTLGIYASQIAGIQGGRNVFNGNVSGLQTSVLGASQGINRESINFNYGFLGSHPTFGTYYGGQLQVRENLDMSSGHGITIPMPAVGAPTVSLGGAGILPANNYYYTVTAFGADDAESAPGLPSAPISADGSHVVDISWTGVPGATKYTAYRNNVSGGAGQVTSCVGVTRTSCSDTCCAAGNSVPNVSATGYPSLYPGKVATQKLIFGSSTAGYPGTSTFSGNFTGTRTINLPDGNGSIPLVASFTSTPATSDNLAIQGMTSSGHCQLTPTNSSAAANFTTTYVSAKTTNQITITHTAMSGMTYDVSCTAN